MKKLFSILLPLFAACGANASNTSEESLLEANNHSFRVATFNTSLYGSREGELIETLHEVNEHVQCVIEVINAVDADILFLNEFDYDESEEAISQFVHLIEQRSETNSGYSYHYIAASNTGIASGMDLDHNGEVVTEPGSNEFGGDALGFGRFEGQYAFAVLSRYPIMLDEIRTFQHFLWQSLPNARLPFVEDSSGNRINWYDDAMLGILPLSSKNHIDLPLQIDGEIVHLLGSHPTPPTFDGPEDRNGCRNHDEVRFWSDYISGANVLDDQGESGSLESGSHFVIVGDLNADPVDGSGPQEGIEALLNAPELQDPEPSSLGAVEASERDQQLNTQHIGDASLDTADFNDQFAGNLRVDYVLPSSTLRVVNSGVYWPVLGDPSSACANISDHHLVWVDLSFQ